MKDPASPGKAELAAHAAPAAVLLLAAAVRVWYLLSLRGAEISRPLGDAATYLGIARTVATEGSFPEGPLFQSAHWFPLMEAAVLKVGLGIGTMHALQYLAGLLTVATVLAAGPAVVGRMPSLAAGAILALYGPGLFQESQLLTAPWAALFLTAGVLLPLGRTKRPGTTLLVSGILLGLGVQSQANMILAVAAFLVALALARSRLGLRPRLLALLPLGLAAALLPPVAHNLAEGGGVAVSTNGGINLFIGNGPGATGLFTLPPGYGLMNDEALFPRSTLTYPARVLGRMPSPSEASRFWAREALGAVVSDPGRAAALLARKIGYLTGAWEPTNYFSYRFFSRWFAPFGWAGDFGILLALAVPGLVLLARQAESRSLLWAASGYAASVLVFFVTDRYRYPLVPLLSLAAGASLARLPGLWSRPVRGRAWVLAAVAVAVFLITRPPAGPAGEREDSSSWQRIGYLRRQGGDRGGAQEAFGRALALDPLNEQALVNLGFVLDEEGRSGEARELYRRALEVNPANGIAWLNLGQGHLAEGDAGSALAHFERGLAANPLMEGLHAGRVEALLSLGRERDAMAGLETARRAGIVTADLLNLRGVLMLRAGDRDAARRCFLESLGLDPSFAPAAENLRRLAGAPPPGG